MPAPKSRQGGPAAAGASLKHINPPAVERKVKFEVRIARRSPDVAATPARALGIRMRNTCIHDFDRARPDSSPPARSHAPTPRPKRRAPTKHDHRTTPASRERWNPID